MITLTLGFIYGAGFILTLVGGAIWMIILNALHDNLHPLKLLGAAIVWPITLTWVGIKMWKVIKEGS